VKVVCCLCQIESPSLSLASDIDHIKTTQEVRVISSRGTIYCSLHTSIMCHPIFRKLSVGYNFRNNVLFPRGFVTPRQSEDTTNQIFTQQLKLRYHETSMAWFLFAQDMI